MSTPCIAVVGTPNSGKTTLYNWLTGSRFKTVNYPGATVEYSIGSVRAALGDGLQFMDTPGVYGLDPKSADEEVTIKALYDRAGQGPADGVLVVVDGTQLERHLQLVLQVRETGFPFLVVVTMSDLLRKEGVVMNWAGLSQALGVPVMPFDGLLGGGLREIVAAVKALPPRTAQLKRPPADEHLEQLHREAVSLHRIALKTVEDAQARLKRLGRHTRTLDQIFLHSILGPLVFLLIMTFLFSSIYWMAKPFMEAVDGGFSWLSTLTKKTIPQPILADFLADGVIASFSAVLVFVPQIFILFVGIGLLESTGYLARAATLIDRLFSAVGLTGRSFVPILSSFSCAVPAIIASRNISSKRDRMITNFILPLMTCSARLPVYALLLGFLFAGSASWKAGLTLALLYTGSLLVGAFAAAILNRMIPKDAASALLMELPLYRKPRFRVVLRQAVTRTWGYALRAGPIIFLIAVVLWWGSNFPNHEMKDASARLEQSYAGRAGHFLEPIVEPMGVDWRVGVGLISAFAAREVFVSTLAVTFNISDENEDTRTEGLLKAMGSAKLKDGTPIFTPASVAGLIVFFMIALQCMSTFAVSQRETGSWRFAFSQLVIFNLVAYVLAVGIYQIAR